MGNPRRFFGADEPIEIDGVTIPPRCAVEVTFRTHQQRLLLRPDDEANEIILGCFGRAYDRYPELNPNILNVMSNHGSFIAVPESPYVLSSFMRDFLSSSATRLNGHRDRDGTFWERRYRAIPIIDEPSMDDRFRYVLTQGTKENLVWSARDWPGISSIKALLGGKPLVGRWLDGTATGILKRQRQRKLDRAEASGRSLELPEVAPVWREYPIELVPMPHWAGLKIGQRRARVAEMLRHDDNETRLRHKRDGTVPLGTKAIRAASPFKRPEKSSKSPAPLCHASTRAGREAFRVVSRAFHEGLVACREAVKRTLPAARVPPHATLPPLTHCPAEGSNRRNSAPTTRERTTPATPANGPPQRHGE